MSLTRTLLLGLIAGGTIFLGLPVGRIRSMRPELRVLLNAVAVGVLIFLVWDVLSAAWEPLDSALTDVHDHAGGGGRVALYGFLFVAGLAVGLLGLVAYERWLARRAAMLSRNFGPGAMSAGELAARRTGLGVLSSGQRLAVLIAVGIGLHNFAEGLAIGQSAAKGDLALATLLVIGFGLHNATEGFGICAPLVGDDERPTWTFLGLMGLIAGGPTFVGAALGHGFTSEPVSVAFLAVAAGSILYVVVQLISVAAKARRTDLVSAGLLLGLLAGFATDAVVTAAGV